MAIATSSRRRATAPRRSAATLATRRRPAPPSLRGRAPKVGSLAAMAMLKAIVISMRPRQWVKNLFVLAGLVFAQRLFTAATWTALAAFAIFCALSGAIYLLNDVADRERDRLDPRKRERPIAAGRLPVGVAVAAAVALILAGLGLSALLARPFLVTVLAY